MQKLTNSYIYTEWIEKNYCFIFGAGAAVLIKRRKK